MHKIYFGKYCSGLVVVCLFLAVGQCLHAGETFYIDGKKYEDATAVPKADFLSIVHTGGITRLSWDDVPERLKTRFPRPKPKAGTTSESNPGEQKEDNRPLIERLTGRYKEEAARLKKIAMYELNPKKARVKKEEAKQADRVYKESLRIFELAWTESGQDERETELIFIEEMDLVFGELGISPDGSSGSKTGSTTEEAKERIDYKGLANITYYGKRYSKKEMHIALRTSGWTSWPIWKLANGRMVSISNPGSASNRHKQRVEAPSPKCGSKAIFKEPAERLLFRMQRGKRNGFLCID